MKGELVVARLGQVLYWTACGVAALSVIGALASVVMGAKGAEYIVAILGAFAVLVWLAGRACLYVLTGR